MSDAWTTVATFLPKLLFFFVVLFVGFLLAKAAAKLTDRVLERVGFDRAVERGGVKQALAKSKYDASDMVAKLVKYAIVLFTLVIAFNVFGPNPISQLLQDVIAFVFVLFLGVVAALNQVGVATTVTTPVLITILATIGGVIVVGAGGGLIRPMQSRWEQWLSNAERETETIKSEVRRHQDGQRPVVNGSAAPYDQVDRDPALQTRQL